MQEGSTGCANEACGWTCDCENSTWSEDDGPAIDAGMDEVSGTAIVFVDKVCRDGHVLATTELGLLDCTNNASAACSSDDTAERARVSTAARN